MWEKLRLRIWLFYSCYMSCSSLKTIGSLHLNYIRIGWTCSILLLWHFRTKVYVRIWIRDWLVIPCLQWCLALNCQSWRSMLTNDWSLNQHNTGMWILSHIHKQDGKEKPSILRQPWKLWRASLSLSQVLLVFSSFLLAKGCRARHLPLEFSYFIFTCDLENSFHLGILNLLNNYSWFSSFMAIWLQLNQPRGTECSCKLSSIIEKFLLHTCNVLF